MILDFSQPIASVGPFIAFPDFVQTAIPTTQILEVAEGGGNNTGTTVFGTATVSDAGQPRYP